MIGGNFIELLIQKLADYQLEKIKQKLEEGWDSYQDMSREDKLEFEQWCVNISQQYKETE